VDLKVEGEITAADLVVQVNVFLFSLPSFYMNALNLNLFFVKIKFYFLIFLLQPLSMNQK